MFKQVVRTQGPETTTERLSAIDYFGTGHTNGAHSGSQRPEEGEEEDVKEDDESESEIVDVKGRKRKAKAVENDVKAKKNKKRNNHGAEEGRWW